VDANFAAVIGGCVVALIFVFSVCWEFRCVGDDGEGVCFSSSSMGDGMTSIESSGRSTSRLSNF
jgi:hypothetical protein